MKIKEATMSSVLEEEDVRPVSNWISGHKRPSLPRSSDGWSSPKAGLWQRQGWSLQEVEVECCIPRQAKQRDTLWRAFPPGRSRHVGSFTLLARAKCWVERELKGR